MAEVGPFAIQPGHRVALFLLSLLLMGLVVELVRRELLREKYALLWLGTALCGLIIGVFPGIIVQLAVWLRFQMLTTLFVLSFVYTLAIILAFTVLISRLSERNRRLAQEIALLTNRVERLEERGTDDEPS